MLFKEIDVFLREHDMFDVLNSLLQAVEKETTFLAELRGVSHAPKMMTDEAQDLYAEDITRAMVDGDYLNPRSVLSHRDRYMTAWAVAQIIVAKQRELAPEEEETDATTTFVKLCQANAELGVKTVEVLQKIDERDLIIEHLREGQRDAATLAAHIVWMANTVHQAYHQTNPSDPFGAPSSLTWQECTKGTCGSIEHILAQAGYDKALQPIPRRS